MGWPGAGAFARHGAKRLSDGVKGRLLINVSSPWQHHDGAYSSHRA
jgi:hypothetical protein